jgi:hypothetical protein
MSKACYQYTTCKLRIAKDWEECPDECVWYVPNWAVQEECEEAAAARDEWDAIEEMFDLYGEG